MNALYPMACSCRCFVPVLTYLVCAVRASPEEITDFAVEVNVEERSVDPVGGREGIGLRVEGMSSDVSVNHRNRFKLGFSSSKNKFVHVSL